MKEITVEPRRTGRGKRYCVESVIFSFGVKEQGDSSLLQNQNYLLVKQASNFETETDHMSSSIDQAAAAESQKFRELLGLDVEKKVEPKFINQTVS